MEPKEAPTEALTTALRMPILSIRKQAGQLIRRKASIKMIEAKLIT